MSTSTLVPVAEYLATSFRPDRDYVDGVIQERRESGVQVPLDEILQLD